MPEVAGRKCNQSSAEIGPCADTLAGRAIPQDRSRDCAQRPRCGSPAAPVATLSRPIGRSGCLRPRLNALDERRGASVDHRANSQTRHTWVRSFISPFKSHTSRHGGFLRSAHTSQDWGAPRAGVGLSSTPWIWNHSGTGYGFRSILIPSRRITPIDATLSYSVPARIRPSLRVSNA